jgi:hypothetical protein
VAAVAATAEIVVAAAVAVAAETVAELSPVATAVGEAWAEELVRSFRATERQIVGAWPGTIGEARMRVLVKLHRKLDANVLDDLARVATLAARRGWHQVSQPDPES